MKPQDLLLNAEFGNASAGNYGGTVLLAPEELWGVSFDNPLSSASINQLDTWQWCADDGGAAIMGRIGTLDDCEGHGLAIESRAVNYLGAVDVSTWALTNATAMPVRGPSLTDFLPGWGLRITAVAPGPCFATLAGPFPLLGAQEYCPSIATRADEFSGNAFYGISIDGAAHNCSASPAHWEWFSGGPETLGAAPADFVFGFVAVVPGDSMEFAWPQAELGRKGTSPILGNERGALLVMAESNRILENGRLSIEYDFWCVRTDTESVLINLFYIDAANRIDIVPDAVVIGAKRLRITIGGVADSSSLFFYAGVHLRFWICCGNGSSTFTWENVGHTNAICASDDFTKILGPWPFAATLFEPSITANLMGNNVDPALDGVYVAVRCYKNNDAPQWAECAC